ncbi:unnamed protein product, partial [Cylicostephanus goldi]
MSKLLPINQSSNKDSAELGDSIATDTPAMKDGTPSEDENNDSEEGKDENPNDHILTSACGDPIYGNMAACEGIASLVLTQDTTSVLQADTREIVQKEGHLQEQDFSCIAMKNTKLDLDYVLPPNEDANVELLQCHHSAPTSSSPQDRAHCTTSNMGHNFHCLLTRQRPLRYPDKESSYVTLVHFVVLTSPAGR